MVSVIQHFFSLVFVFSDNWNTQISCIQVVFIFCCGSKYSHSVIAIFLWLIITLAVRFFEGTVLPVQILLFNLWLSLRGNFQHLCWLYDCFAHITLFPSPNCTCHSLLQPTLNWIEKLNHLKNNSASFWEMSYFPSPSKVHTCISSCMSTTWEVVCYSPGRGVNS